MEQIGLHGTLGSTYSFASFSWVDGSSAGDAIPSSFADLENSGYSHWGFNGSSHEPQAGAGSCVHARTSNGIKYYYYASNDATQATRRTASNYIVSSNTSLNLLPWYTSFCNLILPYICEYTGGWV